MSLIAAYEGKESPLMIPKKKGGLLKKNKKTEEKHITLVKEEIEEEVVEAEETVIDEIETAEEAVTETEEESEETEDDVPEEADDAPEEIKAEEKPKRKRRSAKQKKEETAVKELPEEAVAFMEMPRTQMTFEKALQNIIPQFEDKAWHDRHTSTQETLNSIIIPPDPNMATLLQLLSELSQLRQLIEQEHASIRAEYENLANREPEGLIERVKRINSDGPNDVERRKNGIMAAMEYKTADGNINLYEMAEELRRRHYKLKGFMETIDYRSKALITMNGALKLEQQHLRTES